MTSNQRAIVRGLAGSLFIINALGSLFASLLFWFGATFGDPPLHEYEASRVAAAHWQTLIIIFVVVLPISIVVNALWPTRNKRFGYAVIAISLFHGVLWAYSELRFLWQGIELAPFVLLFLLMPFLLNITVIALTSLILFTRKSEGSLV